MRVLRCGVPGKRNDDSNDLMEIFWIVQPRLIQVTATRV